MLSKPEASGNSGTNPSETWLLDGWQSAYRRHETDLGFYVELAGTSRLDDKGEIQAGETTRVRVPMQETGAEQLVVVMKRL